MPKSSDARWRLVRDLDAAIVALRDDLGDDLPADPRGSAPSTAFAPRVSCRAGPARAAAPPDEARPRVPVAASPRKAGTVEAPAAAQALQTSLLGEAAAPVVASPGLRRGRSVDPGMIEGGEGPPIVRGPCRPERRSEILAPVAAEVAVCTRCRLSASRTNTVFGVGDPCARVCFVGEGPGAEEDRRGEPFVGRAGQLLDKIIAAMGMRRTEVYITNTVKCRPPENRTPFPDEVQACAPYLAKQLETITPQVIVALGRPAVQALLGTSASMSEVRGRFHRHRGIPLMPTYHPAYLLRNPAAKKPTWDDIRQVIRFLRETPDPLTAVPDPGQ